jgi:large subunit ribosomal protein L32
MALPKKRTSRSRRGMRRSHDTVAVPNVIYCECGEPVLPHRACAVCGAYKGRKVMTAKDDA